MNTLHETIAPYFASTKGEAVKRADNKRGRPVSITFADCVNEYTRNLPALARVEAEKNVFDFLGLLSDSRRPLTEAEVAYLATTRDAKVQTLRDGEPATKNGTLQFEIPLAEGNVAEVLQGWVENVVFPSVALAAKFKGTTFSVSVERRSIERGSRGVRKAEGSPDLRGLTSRYQYAVYATDAQEENGTPVENGFLTIGSVSPDGTISRNYGETSVATVAVKAKTVKVPKVKAAKAQAVEAPETPATETPVAEQELVTA